MATEETKKDELLTNDAGVHVHPDDGGRVFQVEGNDVSGFAGVDPEYMNYASVANQPFETDDEKAAREERERKLRVARGEEEPRDDDLVLFEGRTMTYGEAKDAASKSGADAEGASVVQEGAQTAESATPQATPVDRSQQQAQQDAAAKASADSAEKK